MVNGVGGFLVKTDHVCDYIPVVSILSNLIDLFQKCVVLSFMSKQFVANNHYYTYLERKSILRCVVLLIPVIGNIIVAIYAFQKYTLLAAIKQGRSVTLRYLNTWFRDDKDVMLALVKQNGRAFAWASKKLQDDKDVALAAVNQNGMALRWASKKLQNDRDVVLAAVNQNGMAIEDASEELQADEEVEFAAVQQNIAAIEYVRNINVARAAVKQDFRAFEHIVSMSHHPIQKECFDDEDLMLAAVKQNDLAITLASERLKKNKKLFLAAITREDRRLNGTILKEASEDLRDDEEVVSAATARHPDAIWYASSRLQQKLRRTT